MAEKQPTGPSEQQKEKQWPGTKNLKPYKKGQSGNPGGRPKGKSLLAEIRAVLDDDELLGKKNPNGQTNRQVLAQAAIAHARKGNATYFRLVLEYLFGKPLIRIEQKNLNDERPIQADVAAAALEAAMKVVYEHEERS